MKDLTNNKVKMFLKNGFCFRGKVLSQDTQFLELLDEITNESRMISLSDISNIEIQRVKE